MLELLGMLATGETILLGRYDVEWQARFDGTELPPHRFCQWWVADANTGKILHFVNVWALYPEYAPSFAARKEDYPNGF